MTSKVIIIFIAALFVGVGIWLFVQRQETSNGNTNAINGNVAINDLNSNSTSSNNNNEAGPSSEGKVYRNEKYGFSVQYPQKYNYFTASNDDNNLLINWGINAGQELLFGFSVYPASSEQQLLADGMKFSGSTLTLPNGEKAEKVEKGSGTYIIRKNNYVYIIYSLFADSVNAPEYQEYLGMLQTLKILQL